MSPTRVLVVDDDPLVRAALSMVLGGAEGLLLVGEATDGDEVPAAVAATAPDVVLMDVRMARVDGLAATRTILSRPDPPKVAVLTTFHLDQYVVAALEAGASGFLLKDTPPRQIVAAVRAVADGTEMLSPAVTRRLIGDYVHSRGDSRRATAQRRLAVLSAREREILVLVGRGLSNAEAARTAYMTEATVKTYVSRMLSKLGLANRTQAAILAHEAGLLDG